MELDKEALNRLTPITDKEADELFIGDFMAVKIKTPIGGADIEEFLKKNPQFSWKTKRGTLMYVGMFKVSGDLLKVLEFSIASVLSKDFIKVYGVPQPMNVVETAFDDFCWLLSEGTTKEKSQHLKTPINFENAGDLTQVLPSKFCDDVIEMVHVLNGSILEGFFGDCVLTGPYISL